MEKLFYTGLEQLGVTGFSERDNDTLSYFWLPEWMYISQVWAVFLHGPI